MHKEMLTSAWTSVGEKVTVEVDGKSITGRIFSYDYMSKMLVLSKYFRIDL